MRDSFSTLSIEKGTLAVASYDVGIFRWNWYGGSHLDAFRSVGVGQTGYDFGNIIVEAMSRLSAAWEDENRSLYNAIADRIENQLISGRHVTPQGFEPQDVDTLFKELRLNHSRYRVGSTGGDRWGSANIGENAISLNAASITHTILHNFGNNAGRVADVTAGVILHEMMHCNGFRHSLRAGDYIYECSLPELAQDAFLQMQDPSGAYAPYGLVAVDTTTGVVESRCDVDG